MPTTVTASNGNTYHLWQLPDASAPEPEDLIKFTTLDNDLADGYRSTALFGSNTGVREWKLQFPSLGHIDVLPNTVTDINGASVSREQYIRSLYVENKVTGEPFAYQDPNNGQYYLVDFVEDDLSMQRMKVKIFSTGITLRQRRIPGVTVFDPSLIVTSDSYTPSLWLKGEDYTDGTEDWALSSGGGYVITGTGDVNKVSAAQNRLDIIRFSNTTNDGVVGDVGDINLKEFFIVMKMREATFSNNAGIFTSAAGAGTQVLIGSSGTTKFANPSLSATAYTYRKNGVEYAQSDLQAPMNEWGVVHVRYTTGWSVTSGFQFGKNRTTAGTFAEMDVGEIICFTSNLSLMDAREVTEYLTVKWAIV